MIRRMKLDAAWRRARAWWSRLDKETQELLRLVWWYTWFGWPFVGVVLWWLWLLLYYCTRPPA